MLAIKCVGQGLGFFRWNVDDDQAVNASARRVARKCLEAPTHQRVGIAHHDYWRCLIGFPELSDQLERLAQSHAVRQGTQSGALDWRSLSHRVRERKADFDDVSTRTRQALQDI